jgi:glycosyltransferase involved in cell wall biosynthesis
MKARISALIYTKNEEATLPGVIRNVGGAVDEILVLDGGSSDGTRAIAKKMGARVMLRRKDHLLRINEYTNNYYKKFARNNWIIVVDGDELLTPDLKRALPRLIADPRYRAYRFPRRNFVAPGVWCRRCFYPNYQLRLFDRRYITFPKEVHVEATVDGEVKNTAYDMLHLTYLRSKQRTAEQGKEYSIAEPEKLANPIAYAFSYMAVFCYFFFFKLAILEPACYSFVLVRTDYYARHSFHSKSWLSRIFGKLGGREKGWTP